MSEQRTETGGAPRRLAPKGGLAMAAPVAAGLVVLFTIVALVGFAIRTPQPHDIPLGVVGPTGELSQLGAAIGARAPGAFQLTTFASESAARAAVHGRNVDGALVLGAGRPLLIVAGASGAVIPGVITGAITAALGAQGVAVSVQTVDPFPAGDPSGLILFFVVLGLLIGSVVAGALVGFLRDTAWEARFVILAVYAVGAGLVGMGVASWVAGGYGSGVWGGAGLVALAALAVASGAAAGARLFGRFGVAVAALVLILFDFLASGGPLGSPMMPSFYGWLAQAMPAPQLYTAIRGALFFNGAGVGGPVVVLVAWIAGSQLLLGAADLAGWRARRPQLRALGSAV